LGQLFDELRRRNVFRVAVAYLVAAWLALQVADLVLENTNAPDWVMQVLMLLFAIGFPLVLIFSWVYELTPEGLKRENDVDRSKSVTGDTGRKLDQITIGLLVVVLAVVVADRLFLRGSLPESQSASTTAPTDRSIAVLAFEDLSEAGDQGYFADGLSEELLNVLAQVPDLQVAGRTSSFAFKGQNTDLREIGDILNVAHILEGSVRKAGNRIRVTAQLINAETGFHLFSETYNRNLNDIFAVQDELATRIGEALRSELIGSTAVAESSPTEVAAYDLYLEARQKIHTRVKDELHAAVDLLERALALDPDYVPALTQKALAIYLLSDSSGAYGDIPKDEALAAARPLLDRALEIDDRYAEAYAVSGLIMDSEGASVDAQIRTLRRAVALNPSLENARTWLSSALVNSHQFEESRALLEGIVERDPMFGPAFVNLTGTYLRTREFDKAESLIDRVERITGETDRIRQSRAYVALTKGELAEVVTLLATVLASNSSATVPQFFYGIALSSLGDYETAMEIADPNWQITSLAALGELDEARKLLSRRVEAVGAGDMLDIAGYYFAVARDPDGLVDFVETHFDGIDALLDAHPKTDEFFLGYMPPLAWAYSEKSMRVEFDKVVAAMRQVLDLLGAEDSLNQPVVQSDADFSAVTGDVDGVLAKVKRLVDIDTAGVEFFDLPYYERYFEIPAFREMNDIIVARANEERAKLGMDAYRPMTVID